MRVAQPALCRNDQTVGLECPTIPCKDAGEPFLSFFIPRERGPTIRELAFGGNVDGGGEKRFLADAIGRDNLGEGKDVRQAVLAGACDGTVTRAEIDSKKRIHF